MTETLALSTLCENPLRPTGLSTFFPAFVREARAQFPDIAWLVFVGPEASWPEGDPGVRVCRDFPSNERPAARLRADHLAVAGAARKAGAKALVTVGFHPLWDAGLPVAMQVFSVPRFAGASGLRERYRRWAVERGLGRSALVIANSAWTASRLPPARGPVLVSHEGLDRVRFTPDGPRGYPGVEGGIFY